MDLAYPWLGTDISTLTESMVVGTIIFLTWTGGTVVEIYLSDSWPVTQTTSLGGRDYGTPGQILRP